MNDYLKTEKAFFPESWEIKKHYCNIDGEEPKKGEKKYLSHISTQVIDEEMDPVNVTIHEGYMEVDTKDYAYVHFSERQFEFLWDEYLDAQNEIHDSFRKMMEDEKKRDAKNEG
jgi:hypothetical protein